MRAYAQALEDCGFAKLFMDLDVSSMGDQNLHKPVLPGKITSECRGVEGVPSSQRGATGGDGAESSTPEHVSTGESSTQVVGEAASRQRRAVLELEMQQRPENEKASGRSKQQSEAEKLHWYALKVFFNRVPKVRDLFVERGCETYVPVQVLRIEEGGRVRYEERPMVSSLLFVRCDENTLNVVKHENDNMFLCYRDRGAIRPTPVRDDEMRVFIRVTSVSDPGLKYLGENVPDLRKGQKVRVRAGQYAGVEGYVRKLGKDRRVLVALNGVAVVALSFIHPSDLECLA